MEYGSAATSGSREGMGGVHWKESVLAEAVVGDPAVTSGRSSSASAAGSSQRLSGRCRVGSVVLASAGECSAGSGRVWMPVTVALRLGVGTGCGRVWSAVLPLPFCPEPRRTAPGVHLVLAGASQHRIAARDQVDDARPPPSSGICTCTGAWRLAVLAGAKLAAGVGAPGQHHAFSGRHGARPRSSRPRPAFDHRDPRCGPCGGMSAAVGILQRPALLRLQRRHGKQLTTPAGQQRPDAAARHRPSAGDSSRRQHQRPGAGGAAPARPALAGRARPQISAAPEAVRAAEPSDAGHPPRTGVRHRHRCRCRPSRSRCRRRAGRGGCAPRRRGHHGGSARARDPGSTAIDATGAEPASSTGRGGEPDGGGRRHRAARTGCRPRSTPARCRSARR